MSNVIDLAVYRAKREQRIEAQRIQIQRSTALDLTALWGIFVTSYQLIFPFTRKDNE